MHNVHGIEITPRDRVFRAWENSMELVRDYRFYADEVENDENLSEVFEKYAEEEAKHASRFLEILHRLEGKDQHSEKH